MPIVSSRLMWLSALACSFGSLMSAPVVFGAEDSASDFFERKVRPLLVEHCFSCHARGQKKGGLSLANRAGMLAGGENGAVVSLEKPAESSLIAAVEHRGDVQMPPNGKLSKDEIEVLRKWIELGAPWPESANSTSGGLRSAGAITDEDRRFWSFQPVRAAEPPAVKGAMWSRRPLDQFVLAQLEASNLKPVEEADRRTFIRRAALDFGARRTAARDRTPAAHAGAPDRAVADRSRTGPRSRSGETPELPRWHCPHQTG